MNRKYRSAIDHCILYNQVYDIDNAILVFTLIGEFKPSFVLVIGLCNRFPAVDSTRGGEEVTFVKQKG
jgi:hypothetical protein